ncbi:LysR family transcriptional regulator [Actinoplanes friuliensis]|uniref:LysR family transcriptional regulator n=1 Tax=Actinoplanes friuliensis DSM 7358 TaxID=1246995 RepID=U5VUM4_9ACTN|nr:LysR family transcriptional regulator [Actinoplanes friuliensis]AGZ40673.1 LysR family transcriptional regulator [Actinoplanes friuliensis DSM 7358]
MELRELRVFLAVAAERSVSAAACRLRVSQPAVSQTVAALEQQVGAELLVRSSTGVMLTEAGTVLAAEARAVLARYDQALVTVGRFATAGDSLLRIGVPLEFPPTLLPNALKALSGSDPGTRTTVRHLSSAAQLDALRDGELDLGLLRTRPPDRDLDAIEVVEEPLGVLLSASERPGGPDGVRLAALAGLDWVGFPRADSPIWYDEVTAVLRSHGLDPGPASAASESLIPEVKFAAVSSGRAFTFAPEHWAQPLPEGIIHVPLVGTPLIRRTWAVWAADSRRRDLGRLISHLESASS